MHGHLRSRQGLNVHHETNILPFVRALQWHTFKKGNGICILTSQCIFHHFMKYWLLAMNLNLFLNMNLNLCLKCKKETFYLSNAEVNISNVEICYGTWILEDKPTCHSRLSLSPKTIIILKRYHWIILRLNKRIFKKFLKYHKACYCTIIQIHPR